MIDKVKIYVKAGDGGNGSINFHREKYVSHGGPDGGDGGKGGNVIVRIAPGESTLGAYRFTKKYIAENGENGKGGKIHGGNGKDIILPVPEGTVIRDAESGLVIKDMSNCDDFIHCKGGRGGWGNRHFATPTRQIPRFAKNGSKGEEREVILELKMLADVGIIGMPNVGKSTLLSRISKAKPKIADYHFTTLSPNLGVVELGEGRNFVAADIPGLIEGASEGAGLGHDFLRHIERCRLFIHVVDVSGMTGRDPIEDVKIINAELASYNESLADRMQIIAANKADIGYDGYEEFESFAKEQGWDIFKISAATGEGVRDLLNEVTEQLQKLPPLTIYEPEYVEEKVDKTDHSFTIRRENDTYYVESEWLFAVMGGVNFSDRDSMRYFHRILRQGGVIDALREKGCKEGDTVCMYDLEFDFVD